MCTFVLHFYHFSFQFSDQSKQVKGGKKGKKDKRKKKGSDDDEELDAMMAELQLELIEGKKPEPKEPVPVQPVKPKEDEPKVSNGSVPEEVPNAKTNKNKKKDNKNKDSNQQNLQTKATASAKETTKADSESTPTQATEAANADEDAEDDDGKSNKKKDKKKKKDAKEKKEEKKPAKGPGKKQIALMQEILKKQKEEEERFEREEEERIKREEEAEKERLEKLRLEQEKKEKKKLKEKERKERLKKEGKLLTAKQKADILRAKMSLQAAQESGQIIVGKAKVDNKKKPFKKNNNKKEAGDEEKLSRQDSEDKDSSGAAAVCDDDNTEPIDDVEDEEEVIDDWEKIDISSKSKKDKVVAVPTPVVETKKPEPVEVNQKKDDYNLNRSVASRPPGTNRSPIICVLGHVDTGKTKLLDYIRKSHVQDNEAGGITQQIGATFVPPVAIREQTKSVRTKSELSMPGLLIIDTPGHESFTNLRTRGSSLCDIAILVIDIMHGLEKQTIESLDLLKKRKTPFIVALNKIDRLYEWRSNKNKDIEDLVKSQSTNTKLEFEKRSKEVIVQLAEQSINSALFYENPDPRQYVSLVPTSAHSGDGMGNLINLIVHLTQTMLSKKILYIADELDATVLEVKAIPGLGTTIDVILVNGFLKEGQKIVLAGHDGPIVTSIRALLVPQPLKELRIKSPYEELKVIYGSMGVKITAHDLEKAVAGLPLYVAKNDADIERLKEMSWKTFGSAMKAIKCSERGVYVQASTLGSLEALLQFLKDSKIPYAGVRIGPVVKKDVIKASVMLEHNPDHAVILAFDVKVERDAQEMADSIGVKIFSAEIIYHLFDRFTEYKESLKKQRKEQNRHLAVFPCRLRILPNCIFNKRNPIVLGVVVEDGILVPGTPISVLENRDTSEGADLENPEVDLGRVSTIEHDHKQLEMARKGQEVCIKIEHCGGDAPKLYGRHFNSSDLLYSRITRQSIDVMKEHFRDDLERSDWSLMIQIKKLFNIL